MSVLKKLFNPEIDQRSPVQDDLVRKVSYDEDGKEIVSWETFDYKTFQESLGTIEDWSLSNLLKAGIDPAFPIHTGNNTRLDGLSQLGEFERVADKILSESQPKE